MKCYFNLRFIYQTHNDIFITCGNIISVNVYIVVQTQKLCGLETIIAPKEYQYFDCRLKNMLFPASFRNQYGKGKSNICLHFLLQSGDPGPSCAKES